VTPARELAPLGIAGTTPTPISTSRPDLWTFEGAGAVTRDRAPSYGTIFRSTGDDGVLEEVKEPIKFGIQRGGGAYPAGAVGWVRWGGRKIPVWAANGPEGSPLGDGTCVDWSMLAVLYPTPRILASE